MSVEKNIRLFIFYINSLISVAFVGVGEMSIVCRSRRMAYDWERTVYIRIKESLCLILALSLHVDMVNSVYFHESVLYHSIARLLLGRIHN